MNQKQRNQRELAEARVSIIGHVRHRIPELTEQAAQAVLERAKAWGPIPARELARHFAERRDALTAPSPHCPAALVRLLRQLEADGFGEAVTQLSCAMCGRSDRELPRPTPQGRCCMWCVYRTELRKCARCGQEGLIARRLEEGPICRRCYSRDSSLSWEECAGCGQRKLPKSRREDGKALCQSCTPRPERKCIRCGRLRPAHAKTEDGPVCNSCYAPPPRLCGGCGNLRRIRVRAADGQPELCQNCNTGPLGVCSICDRQARVYRVRERGGALHCDRCRPRTLVQCADCGRERDARANWPLGPVCDTCFNRRRRNPAPCSRCQSAQVLIGRADDGGDLCGPCCGTDITYSCSRCGFPGDIYDAGLCTRCSVGDRVRQLLAPGDGPGPSALRPLADALASADHPRSVLTWLRSSSGPKILAELVSQNTEITHASLDALSQDYNSTHHFRKLLVATGVLPERNENLARLESWSAGVLTRLPQHQMKIIGPFAEWQIIRAAIDFLNWLDGKQLDLAAAGQEDLDLWLTTHPTRRRSIGAFIRWAGARRLTSRMALTAERTGLPTQFITETALNEQLKRCLNDDQLPLDVRIAGALIRLYGLPVVRLVELTTDRFERTGDDGYLTIERNPVLLPPKLALLIQEQIARPTVRSMLRPPQDGRPTYLLPGVPAHRPITAQRIVNKLRQHGLEVISARNTAMLEAVADLPPIVISDLFGVSAGSAHRWARFAQDSWTDYLAACSNDEAGSPEGS